MAITQNTYTGNGSTVLFSFTFPYLETTDIKVSLNGVNTTAYTLANATTIQFNSAPANGTAIRIYRQTDDSGLTATFSPGSAIRSQDLNDNFTQNLYVTQEANRDVASALNLSSSANTTAQSASLTASSAVTTANNALSTSNAAVSTANTASATAATAETNSQQAVTTAQSAEATAISASLTANQASQNAQSAVTTSANALSTSQSASTTAQSALASANAAVTNANLAISTSDTALSTSNAATTTAANAVSIANVASADASDAVTVANNADSKADLAINAVSSAVLFTPVAAVANIPAAPVGDDYIEVLDSTGIEFFSPLSGIPPSFTGDPGLSVRLRYSTAVTTWLWLDYSSVDPETRYLKLTGGTLTGPLLVDSNSNPAQPGLGFADDPATGIGHPGGNELSLITGGTPCLTADSSGTINAIYDLQKGGDPVITTGDLGIINRDLLQDGAVNNAKIGSDAEISFSKLAPLSPGYLLIGDSTSVPTALQITGDISISSTGVASIAAGAVGNAELDTITTAGKIANSATTAVSSNNPSAIVARDSSGNFSAGTITASLAGNAATATTLETARTINGVSFNGSANINVPDLRDSNGNILIDGTAVASSVNYISLTNAATGGQPTLSTAGSDTNISLTLTTKGTGGINIITGGGNIALRPTAGSILFYDANNAYYTNLDNGSLTANRTLTMPNGNVTLVAGTMVPTTGTGATGTWGISVSGNAATATTATNCSRSVSAGNGLTGGGALTASRTITLGTPSSITDTSTNSVSASSHTHALAESSVRSLIADGGAGAVGTYALAGSTASGSNRSAGATIAGSSLRYGDVDAANGGGGTPSGTWRLMGDTRGAGADFGAFATSLWLRIA